MHVNMRHMSAQGKKKRKEEFCLDSNNFGECNVHGQLQHKRLILSVLFVTNVVPLEDQRKTVHKNVIFYIILWRNQLLQEEGCRNPLLGICSECCLFELSDRCQLLNEQTGVRGKKNQTRHDSSLHF